MARPTTWFTPLDRPPFVTEHHDPAGAPENLHVLEISSRSGQMFGRTLSALNLRAPGADGDRGVTVESVYQAAKCYGAGGPAERPSPNGYEAKRIGRGRRAGGPLRGFEHEGTFWPAASGSAFYDRLWIRATLAQHGDRRPDEPRRLRRPVPPAGPIPRLPGALGRDARRPRPRPRARARSPAGRVGRHARPARRGAPAAGRQRT
ncbi:MAG: hypothetical protein OXG04_06380, partial [Acidobacteria bacterium]|nr:hypothetical protein [Acidobacteriota bacterium]